MRVKAQRQASRLRVPFKDNVPSLWNCDYYEQCDREKVMKLIRVGKGLSLFKISLVKRTQHVRVGEDVETI